MKLLIADDEESVRSLVRITLETESHEILEARDGTQALDLIREHRPELVLLDVDMPEVSGLDVCRSVKEDPTTSDITVVMLTAAAQESDLHEGEQAGADGYFTKPFSPIALLEKVDEVAERVEP